MLSKLSFSGPATSLVVAEEYPDKTDSYEKTAVSVVHSESHCKNITDRVYEGADILGRACSTVAFASLKGVAQIFTDASNSVVLLSNRVNAYFNNTCHVITNTTTQAVHQKRYRRKVALARSGKRLRHARRKLNKLPAKTWSDTLKNARIIVLRAEQYLCQLVLGEVKKSIDDPTDLYDHYELTGNQVLPDHYYSATNASKAGSIYYGAEGVGVLPCKSTERILQSKLRYGILQLLYSYFY